MDDRNLGDAVYLRDGTSQNFTAVLLRSERSEISAEAERDRAPSGSKTWCPDGVEMLWRHSATHPLVAVDARGDTRIYPAGNWPTAFLYPTTDAEQDGPKDNYGRGWGGGG